MPGMTLEYSAAYFPHNFNKSVIRNINVKFFKHMYPLHTYNMVIFYSSETLEFEIKALQEKLRKRDKRVSCLEKRVFFLERNLRPDPKILKLRKRLAFHVPQKAKWNKCLLES